MKFTMTDLWKKLKRLLSGAGTEEDPYRIYTAEEFYLINYVEYWHEYLDLETVYYRQMDDIDLSQCPSEDNESAYITADFSVCMMEMVMFFHNAERRYFSGCLVTFWQMT